MNKEERMKCVKSMEFLVRQVNDEEVFTEWLGIGVADGDIPYGETEITSEDEDVLDYYIENENFSDLMGLFLEIMHDARNSGGLWCDTILSKDYNKGNEDDYE